MPPFVMPSTLMARAVPGWQEAETHHSVTPVRCEATLPIAWLHSIPEWSPNLRLLSLRWGRASSSVLSSEACDGVEGR